MIVAYFSLSSRIPTDLNKLTGLPRDVHRLAVSAGPVATAAAVTFTAYIVGILSVQLESSARALIVRGTDKFPRWRSSVIFPGKELRISLTGVAIYWVQRLLSDPEVKRRLSRGLTGRASYEGLRGDILAWLSRVSTVPYVGLVEDSVRPSYPDHFQRSRIHLNEQWWYWACERSSTELDSLRRDLLAEMTRVPGALIGAEQVIWSEWDKRRAEADFRSGTSIPILFLTVVLAMDFSMWWWALLVVSVALMVAAARLRSGATALLADVVASGRIPSSELDRRGIDDFIELIYPIWVKWLITEGSEPHEGMETEEYLRRRRRELTDPDPV
ncbi:hypothetical protein ABZT17_41930 [Streptomyces sp. NPDC005648]|uniref:hypothetical protein n=1 Tax=Streptomyces sp. NPDC005648 TaxID=3157044 RepID=UPI0033BDA311